MEWFFAVVFAGQNIEEHQNLQEFLTSRTEYEAALTCLQLRNLAYKDAPINEDALAELPQEVASAPVLNKCTRTFDDDSPLAEVLQQEGPADCVEGSGPNFRGAACMSDDAAEDSDDEQREGLDDAASNPIGTVPLHVPRHTALIGGTELGDENLAWLTIGEQLKDLCAPCRKKDGVNQADRLLRLRQHNASSPDAALAQNNTSGQRLLGRDNLFENKTLGKVRDIQLLAAAAGKATYRRNLEKATQQIHPQKLIVPTHGELANMFDPPTLSMAMPDLFVYCDMVPFILRETPMTFLEFVQMTLTREELAYDLPDEEPGSYVPPQPSRFRSSLIWSPVAYDFQRRLSLIRETKAHVKRRGFGDACRSIASLHPDNLLEAIALLGAKADLQTLISNKLIHPSVREAARSLVLSTGNVLGSEGHRTQLRHTMRAYSVHFGHGNVFWTVNLADGRAALIVEIHLGPSETQRLLPPLIGKQHVEKFRLNLLDECPRMPAGEDMLRMISEDPVAQARFRHIMMTTFWEIGLGHEPALMKERFPAPWTRLYEDNYAASTYGGTWADPAATCAPDEIQDRGTQHSHAVSTLIGHSFLPRLRRILEGTDAEAIAVVEHWRSSVLQAAQRIQYDSQQTLASQLGFDPKPTPLSEDQRKKAGQHYDSSPLQEWEPDGHERDQGARAAVDGKLWRLSLTGAAASTFPLYRRRTSGLSPQAWLKAFYADFRALKIQNHIHKCGKSCKPKKGRAGKGKKQRRSRRTKCRHGCAHYETVEITEDITKRKRPTTNDQRLERQKKVMKLFCGWPKTDRAQFLQPATAEGDAICDEMDVGKFASERHHPTEGPSSPAALVMKRCNVDVKYLGRCIGNTCWESVLEQTTTGTPTQELDNVAVKKMRRTLPSLVSAGCIGNSRLKEHIWQLILETERDMKCVQHYTGEYATKKFEVARELLPQFYRSLQFLFEEKERRSPQKAKLGPLSETQYGAYRTLLRLATAMNRCLSKSRAEMCYQLLYESECFMSHTTYTLFMKFPIWAMSECFRVSNHSAEFRKVIELGKESVKDLARPHDDVTHEEILRLQSAVADGVHAEAFLERTKSETQGDPYDKVGLDTILEECSAASDEHHTSGQQDEDKEKQTASQFITSNQKDDYIHRGNAAVFQNMGLYLYSRFVHRVPKKQTTTTMTIADFADHYCQASTMTQEIRIREVVVQFVSWTLPTALAQPERNAALKLCLFQAMPVCQGSVDEDLPTRLRHCCGPQHWRCHSCRGFVFQWRWHCARRAIFCSRAEERLLSGFSTPVIHDTWSLRRWYPICKPIASNWTDEQYSQVLRTSSHIMGHLVTHCLKLTLRPLPARAWELICWFHGTSGDETVLNHYPLYTGYHFSQLTIEEFNAYIERDIDFRLELTAEANTRRNRPLLQEEVPADAQSDSDHSETRDIESRWPPDSTAQADSIYADRDCSSPLHRLSVDLLFEVVHREQHLRSEAKKIDGPGKKSCITKALHSFMLAFGVEYDSMPREVLSSSQCPNLGLSARLNLGPFSSQADFQQAVGHQKENLSSLTLEQEDCTTETTDTPAAVLMNESDGTPSLQTSTDATPDAPREYAWILMKEATCNAEQVRACAPIVLALQKMWENRVDQKRNLADGPLEEQVVVAWLGAAGSGKTWAYTKVIRPLYNRYLPNLYQAMAPTHSAARLMGKETLTLHKAAAAGFQQEWHKEALNLKGGILQRMQSRWNLKRAVVIDEIGMAPPEVYHGLSLRSTYARQAQWSLDVNNYMQEWFGKMPIGLQLGDFLQVRPARRRSLCEVLDHTTPEESQEETSSELGRQMFDDTLTSVHLFTCSNRFSRCPSGQALYKILQCIRLGKSIPEDHWQLLRERVLCDTGKDPRLDDAKFRNGLTGAFAWEVVSRLLQLRAWRGAREQGKRLFYTQAVDVPTQSCEHFSRADVVDALKVVNMTSTAYLPGVCAFFIGMHGRITANCLPPWLVRDVTGVVVDVIWHPQEVRVWESQTNLSPVLLRFLPLALIIKLEDEEYAGEFLDGYPAGHVALEPFEGNWKWRQKVCHDDGRYCTIPIDLTRRQIPFAPQGDFTHFGIQGKSADTGMTAYLHKTTDMSEGDLFLGAYTLLSRARKLEDLLISGLPDRDFLEAGPDESIKARVLSLEARSVRDIAVADAAVLALNWPSVHEFEDQSKGTTSLANTESKGTASRTETTATTMPTQTASNATATSLPRIEHNQNKNVRAHNHDHSTDSILRNRNSYSHYFEPQEQAKCARHALNNAIGSPLFDDFEMDKACALFVAESTVPSHEGGPISLEQREDHQAEGGWYSIEVMAYALRRTMMFELLPEPVGITIRLRDSIVDPQYAGLVVHQAWPQKHWVAIRYIDEKIWLLDSLGKPRALNKVEYHRFVTGHPIAFLIRKLGDVVVDAIDQQDSIFRQDVLCLD